MFRKTTAFTASRVMRLYFYRRHCAAAGFIPLRTPEADTGKKHAFGMNRSGKAGRTTPAVRNVPPKPYGVLPFAYAQPDKVTRSVSTDNRSPSSHYRVSLSPPFVFLSHHTFFPILLPGCNRRTSLYALTSFRFTLQSDSSAP